jgi:eukaryotic-like serine/threonine-protein kinase
VAELLPGQVLDQYQIVDVLARGGMATLFRARDIDTGQTVVLKVPHLQYESDVVFHERFKREEEIGQRLEHPAVIKILRPRNKSRMYLAMEFVEGESLRERLQDERELRGVARLPVATAVELGIQIAEALVYLHEHGVVHRDLKPENIMLLRNGRVKLMDLGIALDLGLRRMTWAGLSQVTGTPDYMAPEQIKGKRGDTRTDLYSVGAIVYEMLTGEVPFPGTNVYSAMQAKLHDPLTPPRQIRPDIPPGLEAVVLRALERDPRDRPQGARELREWLANPAAMALADQERPRPRRVQIPALPRWLLVLLIVVPAMIAFTLLVSLLGRALRGH